LHATGGQCLRSPSGLFSSVLNNTALVDEKNIIDDLSFNDVWFILPPA
jgi:hypothetical protein